MYIFSSFLLWFLTSPAAKDLLHGAQAPFYKPPNQPAAISKPYGFFLSYLIFPFLFSAVEASVQQPYGAHEDKWRARLEMGWSWYAWCVGVCWNGGCTRRFNDDAHMGSDNPEWCWYDGCHTPRVVCGTHSWSGPQMKLILRPLEHMVPSYK